MLKLVSGLVALMAGLAFYAFTGGTVVAHEDGLTCHDHPTGGWQGLAQFAINGNSPGEPILIVGLVFLEADEVGNLRLKARGAAVLRVNDRLQLLPANGGDASAVCSEVGITSLTLSFEKNNHRLLVSVIPSQPVRESGHHKVRFLIETPGDQVEMDGAILVVSALDATGP